MLDPEDHELGGRDGREPITQISRPLSISSCVIVVRSQLTKKASSGVVPSARRARQTVSRNCHRLGHSGPERLVVRLEDDPLACVAKRRAAAAADHSPPAPRRRCLPGGTQG